MNDDNEMFRCCYCGSEHEDESALNGVGCDDCTTDCFNCGRTVSEDDLNDAGCEDCTYYCDGGHYVDYDFYMEGRDGYCPDCAEEYCEPEFEYHIDARCGTCRSARELTHWHPVTEVAVCMTCAGPDHEPIPELEAA